MRTHGLSRNIGADFVTFYAASTLVLSGHPADVYRKASQMAAERASLGEAPHRTAVGTDSRYDGFFYPPMVLVLIEPLAKLPYWKALALFTVVTLCGYAAVMRGIIGDWNALWLLAFPGVWVNALEGQNGVLTLVILGGGLLLLDRRPLPAGAMFGLLTYKPQFGLLIPLLLLMDRKWGTIASTVLTAAGFALLSIAFFGTEPWRAFIASIPHTRQAVLEQGGVGFGKLQSVFAAARLLGATTRMAYAIQSIASLCTIAAVLWLWRKSANRTLKFAALAAGTLLVTPYMFDYDLAVLALPIAWVLVDARGSGFRPWEKLALGLIWIFPLFARGLALLASVPLTPLMLVLMLLVIWRRAIAPAARVQRIPSPAYREPASA